MLFGKTKHAIIADTRVYCDCYFGMAVTANTVTVTEVEVSDCNSRGVRLWFTTATIMNVTVTVSTVNQSINQYI